MSKATPSEISRKFAERIKQLALTREMLALEQVPKDLAPAVDNAVDHIDFILSDLKAELYNFNIKYGLGSGLQKKGE